MDKYNKFCLIYNDITKEQKIYPTAYVYFKDENKKNPKNLLSILTSPGPFEDLFILNENSVPHKLTITAFGGNFFLTLLYF